jgi:hypothetical protein
MHDKSKDEGCILYHIKRRSPTVKPRRQEGGEDCDHSMSCHKVSLTGVDAYL